MSNPFGIKLERFTDLTSADRDALRQVSARTIQVGPRDLLIAEGERHRCVLIVIEGWSCRFKALPGASRQIVSFLLPGDHVGASPHPAQEMGSGVCTLTACEVAEIDFDAFDAFLEGRPNVTLALQRIAMFEQAILHEWLAGLGRRPAERRMAHLFCELLVRLQQVGSADADGYDLSLTQATLGDALGLSPAHVNRSLQSLRARDLVALQGGAVKIADVARLKRFAGFHPRYLEVQRLEPAGAPQPA